MAALAGPDTDVCKLLHRFYVSDWIAPRTVEGPSSQALLRSLCAEVASVYEETYLNEVSPIIRASLVELLRICRALSSLLATDLDSDVDKDCVEQVFGAKQGTMLLVKQACPGERKSMRFKDFDDLFYWWVGQLSLVTQCSLREKVNLRKEEAPLTHNALFVNLPERRLLKSGSFLRIPGSCGCM